MVYTYFESDTKVIYRIHLLPRTQNILFFIWICVGHKFQAAHKLVFNFVCQYYSSIELDVALARSDVRKALDSLEPPWNPLDPPAIPWSIPGAPWKHPCTSPGALLQPSCNQLGLHGAPWSWF